MDKVRIDYRDLISILDTTYCSLTDRWLAHLLFEVNPASQAESKNDLNIGYGFLYYALGRLLRPDTTVVLGSLNGFSPICFALGMKDNGRGELYFVDAGYDDRVEGRPVGSGGGGYWRQPDYASKIFKRFGVANQVKFFLTTTKEFLKQQDTPPIDLLFIDANHSFEDFKHDFENYTQRLNERGLVAFHDVLVEEGHEGYKFGIGRYYEKVLKKDRNWETFVFPVWPGVGLARKVKHEQGGKTK